MPLGSNLKWPRVYSPLQATTRKLAPTSHLLKASIQSCVESSNANPLCTRHRLTQLQHRQAKQRSRPPGGTPPSRTSYITRHQLSGFALELPLWPIA